MKFSETEVAGAYVIELEPIVDDRGFFARSWCRDEFSRTGLNSKLAQCSISFNKEKGILRGMHFQSPPFPEVKVVRCSSGVIYDVVLDIRRSSPTYRKWFAVELSSQNHKMLYIPEGTAHGFQTLTDNCEVFYQISELYHPECAQGVRWNDPYFSIVWPIACPKMSERDRSFPDYQ